jgi:hypothetical protein
MPWDADAFSLEVEDVVVAVEGVFGAAVFFRLAVVPHEMMFHLFACA